MDFKQKLLNKLNDTKNYLTSEEFKQKVKDTAKKTKETAIKAKSSIDSNLDKLDVTVKAKLEERREKKLQEQAGKIEENSKVEENVTLTTEVESDNNKTETKTVEKVVKSKSKKETTETDKEESETDTDTTEKKVRKPRTTKKKTDEK